MKRGCDARTTFALTLTLALGAWGCEEKKEASAPAAEQPAAEQDAPREAESAEEVGETYEPEIKGTRALGWDASKIEVGQPPAKQNAGKMPAK